MSKPRPDPICPSCNQPKKFSLRLGRFVCLPCEDTGDTGMFWGAEAPKGKTEI